MMKWMCGALISIVASASPAAANEPGQDHSILGRFAPAQLTHYSASAYDAVRLPGGPFIADGDPETVHEQEGRITWLGYRVPEEHSMLEVARNYEEAIAESDFETVYSCEGSECGDLRQLHRWLTDNSF